MEAALHVIRHYVTFGPMLCLVVVFASVLVHTHSRIHSQIYTARVSEIVDIC